MLGPLLGLNSSVLDSLTSVEQMQQAMLLPQISDGRPALEVVFVPAIEYMQNSQSAAGPLAPDVVQIPAFSLASVPIYNLGAGSGNGGMSDSYLALDSATTLVLSVDVLARIFRADITQWNHPAIVALNPQRVLPSAGITVVMGTTAKSEAWDVLMQASCKYDHDSWQADVGGCDAPYTNYAPVASRYSSLRQVDTVAAATSAVLSNLNSIGFSTLAQIAIYDLNSIDMLVCRA